MEAVGLCVLGAALAAIGYFGRRVVERSAETERLQRLSLSLDIEKKLHQSSASSVAALVLLVIRGR